MLDQKDQEVAFIPFVIRLSNLDCKNCLKWKRIQFKLYNLPASEASGGFRIFTRLVDFCPSVMSIFGLNRDQQLGGVNIELKSQ